MVKALVPLTIYIALIPLAPLVLGIVIFALTLVVRASRLVVLALGALGALVPVVALPFLAPEVASGEPIAIRPFGAGTGLASWLAPAYRVDAFTLYAAMGVAYLAVPLLFWLAFAERSRPTEAEPGEPDTSAKLITDEEDSSESVEVATASESPQLASGDAEDAEDDGDGTPALDSAREIEAQAESAVEANNRPTSWSVLAGLRRPATASLARTAALALGIEAAALSLVFADAIFLLGLAWIVLAALAWAAGETNSDAQSLDATGLLSTVVGPALWLVVMLFVASSVHAPRLLDLTGRGAFSPVQTVAVAVALALAGAAWPFLAWALRRTALATPTGVASLTLLVMPAALYAGLRTYAAAADSSNLWPQIGAARPPVTAGIAFAVLGAITIASAGILALGRRDARGMVALLASAQVGWGLLGIGVGQAVGALGVVLLLPAGLLGLGAMLAALVAGGALTSDLEPDADGPRPVGVPLRPLALAAWAIGGASLIGAPFLAGFAPRHLISVGTLQSSGLAMPLLGICWAGDALLAVALLRSTAPALGGRVEALGHKGTSVTATDLRDVAGTVLATLALVAGIAPALVIGQVGRVAAAPLVSSGSLASVTVAPLGYVTSASQWLSVVAWLGIVVVGIWLFALWLRGGRVKSPVYLGGRAAEPLATDVAGATTAVVGEESLSDPATAWHDLAPAFDSGWTVPARAWLLANLDDDSDGNGSAEGDETPEALPVPAHAEHAEEERHAGD